jgi:Cu/Ag efflux protein CusF
MKVVSNRIRWAIPALAAVLIGRTMRASHAAPDTPATKAVKPARAPKPKSKTAEGTFAVVSATQVKLTTKAGELASNLVPTTEYYRLNEDVAVADLKTGDMVKFPLRGTDGLPTVQSVAPLTLKFGDEATLTFTKSDKMKLDRVTKITATDLAVGQEARVASNLFDDGHMEAREVWVSIPAPKMAKPEAKPKA